MECAKADGLIEKYIDGVLSEALAAELESHIGSCARCRTRVHAARRISRILEEPPSAAVPEGFTDKVMEEIGREEKTLHGKPPLD